MSPFLSLVINDRHELGIALQHLELAFARKQLALFHQEPVVVLDKFHVRFSHCVQHEALDKQDLVLVFACWALWLTSHKYITRVVVVKLERAGC